MSIEQEKLKALNQALGKIEKDFGKGSVMKLGRGYIYGNRCYTNRVNRT